MNRTEAINALKEGKRLSHKRFTPEEWVEGSNSRFYVFEDGCRCPAAQFWKIRQSPGFDHGWVELVKEVL